MKAIRPDTVLLIGSDGMLGRAMAAELARRGVEARLATLDAIDLERPETIVPAIAGDVSLVVNCAAYTDVDGAEREPERAMRVNGEGVGALADTCRETGAMLVHFSTDYVFDGRAREPYLVDHPVAPIGAYGRSKARGESLVKASGARHLLVRTSWLHAPWGKCFPRTILELARTRETLRVVDDQRGRPTFAPHLARATLDLVERGAEGTFHVTDGGECTWYELAREIIARAKLPCDVTPCTTADMPRLAARPAYSVLAIEATEALLGPMPPWTTHL